MAENSDAEKKHDPTPQRLRRAREEGQIRRSNDLPKAAMTLAMIVATTAAGGFLAGVASRWMVASLVAAGTRDFHTVIGLDLEFGVALVSFAIGIGLLALLAGVASGGWMMSLVLLLPKLERLDPAKSWGQMFSLSNLVEVGKSILKIVVIGGAGWAAYVSQKFDLLALATPRRVSLSMLGGPAFEVVLGAAAGALVLAALDVLVQAWLNRRSLRMTDQEMKDEVKNMDGDPHVRARRRSLMRKAARARQIQSVKTATMVVTNPTHYAVAVRYRRGDDKVPIVLAKGVDEHALAITVEATSHGVPLVEAPPLARALHRQVEVDRPIPSHLYRAVAEVVAYVWRVEAWRKAGYSPPPRPNIPESVEALPGADA